MAHGVNVKKVQKEGEKSGEWRVQDPLPNEKEYPNNASHVRLSAEVMMDLGLKNGHICRLWKTDTPDLKYDGIAMACINQKINYNNARFYNTLRERCAFEPKDRICISAVGPPPIAESICLRDVSPLLESKGWMPISEEDRPHWEWALEDSLGKLLILSFLSIQFLRILETLQSSSSYFENEQNLEESENSEIHSAMNDL